MSVRAGTLDSGRDPYVESGHVSRAPGLPGRGEHHGVDTEYLDCEIHLLCHFCRLHDVFDIVIKPIVNFVHLLMTQKISIVAATILKFLVCWTASTPWKFMKGANFPDDDLSLVSG